MEIWNMQVEWIMDPKCGDLPAAVWDGVFFSPKPHSKKQDYNTGPFQGSG